MNSSITDPLSLRTNILRLAEKYPAVDSFDGEINLDESAIKEFENFSLGFIHLLFNQTWPKRAAHDMSLDCTSLKEIIRGLLSAKQFEAINNYVRQYWNQPLFGAVKNKSFDPNAQRYLGLVLEYFLYDWMRMSAMIEDGAVNDKQVITALHDSHVLPVVRDIASRISSHYTSDPSEYISTNVDVSIPDGSEASQPAGVVGQVSVNNTVAILDPDQLAAYFITLITRAEASLGEAILSDDGRDAIREIMSADLYDNGVIMNSDWFTTVAVPSPQSYDVTMDDDNIILYPK